MIGEGEEHLHASPANVASYVEDPAIGVSSILLALLPNNLASHTYYVN
jgi:hypothetical protein